MVEAGPYLLVQLGEFGVADARLPALVEFLPTSVTGKITFGSFQTGERRSPVRRFQRGFESLDQVFLLAPGGFFSERSPSGITRKLISCRVQSLVAAAWKSLRSRLVRTCLSSSANLALRTLARSR